MNTKMKTIFGAAVAAILVTPTASAAAWLPSKGQSAEAPRIIYAETDTGGALLSCSQAGKLKTILSSSGEDFGSRVHKSAKYRRGIDVALTVGETVNGETRWHYMPAIETIYSTHHSQAAKLYNAVVRGDEVSVSVDGKIYTTMTLPAVDSTFRAFAKTCNAKKPS